MKTSAEIQTSITTGINHILALDLSSNATLGDATAQTRALRHDLEAWHKENRRAYDAMCYRLDSVGNMLGEAEDSLAVDGWHRAAPGLSPA